MKPYRPIFKRDQDDRAAGRRLRVRIRHPGMERPDRGFDAERQEEAQEQQQVGRFLAGKQAQVDMLLQCGQVKRRLARR